MIVALVGVDGSGKTTQAARLAAWLSGQGIPAHAFENPSGRMRLDRLSRRLGHPDARSLLGRAYVPVETAVRGVAITRALLFGRLTRRAVVMDRYSYCQYAVMRARSDPGERWVRRFLDRFPRPDVVCLLAVPPAVAQHRVRLRGTDREELAHLVALDDAYRSLPEFVDFHVVAAEGDPDSVQGALREALRGYAPATGRSR